MIKYKFIYLLLLGSITFGEELNLKGWDELPVSGDSGGLISKSYSKTEEIGQHVIRQSVSHVYSSEKNVNNVINEIRIKGKSESDLEYVLIARAAIKLNSPFNVTLFLDSFGNKYQVYGGIKSDDSYFANKGDRFISIIPAKIQLNGEYWLVMFICDNKGIYHLYNKEDWNKYNRASSAQQGDAPEGRY